MNFLYIILKLWNFQSNFVLTNRNLYIIPLIAEKGQEKDKVQLPGRKMDYRIEKYLTWKHSGGIKMGKSSSGSRIRQVISRHVDSLDGGDRPLLGCGDTLLQPSKIGGKGWLVTHGRRDTTQQGRHLRVRL